jgi:hypothetical protein
MTYGDMRYSNGGGSPARGPRQKHKSKTSTVAMAALFVVVLLSYSFRVSPSTDQSGALLLNSSGVSEPKSGKAVDGTKIATPATDPKRETFLDKPQKKIDFTPEEDSQDTPIKVGHKGGPPDSEELPDNTYPEANKRSPADSGDKEEDEEGLPELPLDQEDSNDNPALSGLPHDQELGKNAGDMAPSSEDEDLELMNNPYEKINGDSDNSRNETGIRPNTDLVESSSNAKTANLTDHLPLDGNETVVAVGGLDSTPIAMAANDTELGAAGNVTKDLVTTIGTVTNDAPPLAAANESAQNTTTKAIVANDAELGAAGNVTKDLVTAIGADTNDAPPLAAANESAQNTTTKAIVANATAADAASSATRDVVKWPLVTSVAIDAPPLAAANDESAPNATTKDIVTVNDTALGAATNATANTIHDGPLGTPAGNVTVINAPSLAANELGRNATVENLVAVNHTELVASTSGVTKDIASGGPVGSGNGTVDAPPLTADNKTRDDFKSDATNISSTEGSARKGSETTNNVSTSRNVTVVGDDSVVDPAKNGATGNSTTASRFEIRTSTTDDAPKVIAASVSTSNTADLVPNSTRSTVLSAGDKNISAAVASNSSVPLVVERKKKKTKKKGVEKLESNQTTPGMEEKVKSSPLNNATREAIVETEIEKAQNTTEPIGASEKNGYKNPDSKVTRRATSVGGRDVPIHPVPGITGTNGTGNGSIKASRRREGGSEESARMSEVASGKTESGHAKKRRARTVSDLKDEHATSNYTVVVEYGDRPINRERVEKSWYAHSDVERRAKGKDQVKIREESQIITGHAKRKNRTGSRFEQGGDGIL